MDITIIGSGLRVPDQLTIEALEVISNCKVVFTIFHPKNLVIETIDWYKSRSDFKFPETNVICLDDLYESNRLRKENYTDAANTIINGVKEFGTPVAYLTQGNPVNLDQVTAKVIKLSKELGYSCDVIPGVSSIDTMLVDLRVEIAPGLQIFEASCLVGQGLKPDNRLSCIIQQISHFGTNYIIKGRKPKIGYLTPLKDYLIRFYPKEHEVIFVRSRFNADELSRIKIVKIENLDSFHSDDLLGSSLYIPPSEKPLMEKSFADQMTNQHYLEDTFPIRNL